MLWDQTAVARARRHPIRLAGQNQFETPGHSERVGNETTGVSKKRALQSRPTGFTGMHSKLDNAAAVSSMAQPESLDAGIKKRYRGSDMLGWPEAYTAMAAQVREKGQQARLRRQTNDHRSVGLCVVVAPRACRSRQ